MSRFLLPAAHIACHGTQANPCSYEQACGYTRWLARSHYENFPVVSLLLPRELHQDFYNVYAFCRWSDDLADEIGDPSRSLELLAWWGHELTEMYAGRCRHPVYIALARTVARHRIPVRPFEDLIRAFVQDQTVTRYESWDQLLAYCSCSANPVGRLVLHLCGFADAERQRLSDFTCTALQLANFWQDVRRDWIKDRVYIPAEIMERHGYWYDDLARGIKGGQPSPHFREMMRWLVDTTEAMFQQGLPLAERVGPRLGVDIELFSRGGLAVLDGIRRQEYDVLRQRPAIGPARKVGLLLRTLARRSIAGTRVAALRQRRA